MQGKKEFLNEVKLAGKNGHRNLVNILARLFRKGIVEVAGF